MSAGASPITPEQFATALESLPVSNLYGKALELRNSIAHLERSNAELHLFAHEVGGDADCIQAIQENENVIGRMRQRIQMVKLEVERRGARWHELDESSDTKNNAEEGVNGHAGSGLDGASAFAGGALEETQPSEGDGSRRPGGRLTDEELRHQLQAQMEDDGEDDDGVHL